MFKLWGRNTSSNVQKVRWLCAEIGVSYDQTEVGGPYGRTKEAFYLAMNPNSLVPTIDDAGFTLYESNSIMRYLASKHAAHAFYPQQLQQRADCERWLDWSLSTIAPAITPVFWGLIRTEPAKRDVPLITAQTHKTFSALQIIEQRLADRAYLCGESLTLADIPIAIQAHRWFNLPFEQINYQRPALPRVRGWYEQICLRPAFQQTVLIPLV